MQDPLDKPIPQDQSSSSTADIFDSVRQTIDTIRKRAAPSIGDGIPYSWPLPPGVSVDIAFQGGEPTSAHIAQLIGYLELFKAALEAQERAALTSLAPVAEDVPVVD